MIDSEFHGHTAESKQAAQVAALRARIEDLETQLEVMGAVLEGEVGRCREADEWAEKAEAMLVNLAGRGGVE